MGIVIDKVLAFIEYSGHQMELQELSDDESDFIDEKQEEKQETEFPLFIFGHPSIYGGNLYRSSVWFYWGSYVLRSYANKEDWGYNTEK